MAGNCTLHSLLGYQAEGVGWVLTEERVCELSWLLLSLNFLDYKTWNYSVMTSIMFVDNKTFYFSGSSIQCHQCNSYDSYHCADPFYYEDSPDTPKTLEFLKDCPADTADKTYFCRKIYQNGEWLVWQKNNLWKSKMSNKLPDWIVLCKS